MLLRKAAKSVHAPDMIHAENVRPGRPSVIVDSLKVCEILASGLCSVTSGVNILCPSYSSNTLPLAFDDLRLLYLCMSLLIVLPPRVLRIFMIVSV